ncbi:outer membrane beta-barrel protein [Flavobacterium sp. FlaQc-47]|jgi:hypothetical protein|uniref:outer membrane beta-barrel protein n=1 Tax=Flavobacterium sp. FlaQc-47 TaxID=3374180 RepID=UPI00375736C1
MKKMLLILALAMISFANAQKGTILVMGNVTYSSQNLSVSNLETKSHNFAFSPKVGYQFHENWTAGVESAFSNSKQNSVFAESKATDFSIGGFLRYSKPISETFAAYADLGAGYQKRKSTNATDIGMSETEGNGFYIGITPAIFINVSKGFGLNFNIGGLGYNTLNIDGENVDGNKVKNFEVSFGKAFSVGISKNF